MSKEEIKFFVEEMYNNREIFISVNGLSNATNSNYMLVSDVVTEHSELFADIVKEAMTSFALYTPSTGVLRA